MTGSHSVWEVHNGCNQIFLASCCYRTQNHKAQWLIWLVFTSWTCALAGLNWTGCQGSWMYLWCDGILMIRFILLALARPFHGAFNKATSSTWLTNSSVNWPGLAIWRQDVVRMSMAMQRFPGLELSHVTSTMLWGLDQVTRPSQIQRLRKYIPLHERKNANIHITTS